MSVRSTTPLASDASESLRVTFLAPQRATAPPRPHTLASSAATITPAGERYAPAATRPIDSPNAPAASLEATANAQTRADVRGRQIRIHLDRALRASFQYPLIAQRQGWQGEVRIALTIRADGLLDNIRVSRSSGYPVLDDAAMESVRRIRAIPQAIVALDGKTIDLVLPVRYELRRS